MLAGVCNESMPVKFDVFKTKHVKIQKNECQECMRKIIMVFNRVLIQVFIYHFNRISIYTCINANDTIGRLLVNALSSHTLNTGLIVKNFPDHKRFALWSNVILGTCDAI